MDADTQRVDYWYLCINLSSCHLSNERICVIRCTNCVYMQNMWKCCFQAIKKFSREEMCIIGAANNC